MPLTEAQLIALSKVSAAQKPAKPKRARSRFGDGVPRGKLGYVPKQPDLPIRPDLAEQGITAKNARGYGYFAVRETIDRVNHLNDSTTLHPGDRDYGVVKAKNGRTSPLPTKFVAPAEKPACDGDHEGPCVTRLPQPADMIRYRR